jgi:hypothetical protein
MDTESNVIYYPMEAFKWKYAKEFAVDATTAFEIPSPLDDEDYADMFQLYVEEPEKHVSES